MKIAGRFVFDGSRTEVWDLLMDPDVLRGAIPGVQEWREAGPDDYEATMKIGIAAVSGTYRGRVTAVDQIPPASYTLRVEGSGGPGFITAEGHVRLTEEPGPQTVMEYDGDAQVGGALAGIGQRMLPGVAKLLIGQGLKSMAKQLAERRAAGS